MAWTTLPSPFQSQGGYLRNLLGPFLLRGDQNGHQALMAFWATLGSFLVQLVAPEAGGTGSAENKGTLGHDDGDVDIGTWWGWVCRCIVT